MKTQQKRFNSKAIVIANNYYGPNSLGKTVSKEERDSDPEQYMSRPGTMVFTPVAGTFPAGFSVYSPETVSSRTPDGKLVPRFEDDKQYLVMIRETSPADGYRNMSITKLKQYDEDSVEEAWEKYGELEEPVFSRYCDDLGKSFDTLEEAQASNDRMGVVSEGASESTPEQETPEIVGRKSGKNEPVLAK